MKIHQLLTPLGACLLAATPGVAAQGDSPFLPLKVQDAFVRGEKEQLPVLIWFSDPELPECRRMGQIFQDATLSAWLKENTISIQVHPLKEPKLAAHYAAQAPPTTVLCRSNRELIERLDGVVNAADFLSTFELAITGLRVAIKPEGVSATDPYAWLAWANHLLDRKSVV